MNKRAKESIELTLPINAAYVSAARMTASSIANRMDFDIEEIEDIKSAVSEACAYVIKKAPPRLGGFKLTFTMQDGLMEIRISCEAKIVSSGEEEISIRMIKALMDVLAIESPDNRRVDLLMRKRKKRNEFSSEAYVGAGALI